MSVNRGWTWLNENEPSESDEAVLAELARQWSEIQSEIEAEGFQRQFMAEEGDDRDWEEGEWEEHQKSERRRNTTRQTRLNVIEGMLAAMGARMMRPYEHWNEDERYMEYMENRP